MSRLQQILKHADLSRKGIEVAPYFNPTLRKSDGYDLLILDVFDTDRLHQNAADDPLIPQHRISEIEPVDLVGDASGIGDLVRAAGLDRRIGYILSSHNFEHLPNPIRFLQGAFAALEPGGILSMAVPDCRACFDYFRMPTRLTDWLAAFHEDRRQPSAEVLFETVALGSPYVLPDGQIQTGCDMATGERARFMPPQTLHAAYSGYLRDKSHPGDYRDAHCSVFFPESLELLLTDLRRLDLIGFDIVEISPTVGLEFYVHLRKPQTDECGLVPEDVFYARRAALLHSVMDNIGAAPYRHRPVEPMETTSEPEPEPVQTPPPDPVTQPQGASSLSRKTWAFWRG